MYVFKYYLSVNICCHFKRKTDNGGYPSAKKLNGLNGLTDLPIYVKEGAQYM